MQVEQLKSNYERKRKARARFQQYADGNKENRAATDYLRWDLWCPSDDEDDMLMSCTPNTPEFRALEKDVDERHARMVRQRQVAERQRQSGNAAFKQRQFAEAYRCYCLGLDSEKHNIQLQANAAMAALKMGSYREAKEHCDKVISLAEWLLQRPDHPLVVKALHRRAQVYQHWGDHNRALQDLRAACCKQPGNLEVASLAARIQEEVEEKARAASLLDTVRQAPSAQQVDNAPGAKGAEHASAHSRSGSAGQDDTALELKRLCEDCVARLKGRSVLGEQGCASTSRPQPNLLQGLARIKELLTTCPVLVSYLTATNILAALLDYAATWHSIPPGQFKATVPIHAAVAAILLQCCSNSTAQLQVLSRHATRTLAWALASQPPLGAIVAELFVDGTLEPSCRRNIARALVAGDLQKPAHTALASTGPVGIPSLSATRAGQQQADVACCAEAQNLATPVDWLITRLESKPGVPCTTLVQLLGNVCLEPDARRYLAARSMNQLVPVLTQSLSQGFTPGLRTLLYNVAANSALDAAIRQALAAHTPLLDILVRHEKEHSKELKMAAACSNEPTAPAHAIAQQSNHQSHCARLALLQNLCIEEGARGYFAKRMPLSDAVQTLDRMFVVLAGYAAAGRERESGVNGGRGDSNRAAQAAGFATTAARRLLLVIAQLLKCEGYGSQGSRPQVQVLVLLLHRVIAAQRGQWVQWQELAVSGVLDGLVLVLAKLKAKDTANELNAVLTSQEFLQDAVHVASQGSDIRKGNCALLFSELAKSQNSINLLLEHGVLTWLIEIAKSEGKDQRNAAIALARCAQDSKCMQMFREEQVIQIIYQNTKL